MKTIPLVAIAAALLLNGCAADGPATRGASVRALMASQIIPPQPHEARGADGAAAAAAYTNYKQSYVTPVPVGDSTLVGGRK